MRQALTTENKVSKYLMYAIGEIVLVVIGILIALQINEWNEKRKNEGMMQNYFVLLREEFTFNKKSLQKVIRLNDTNANHALSILNYTGPAEPMVSEILFDSLVVYSIGSEVEFRPRTEVIDELIASGKLSLVENADLRTSLSSWPETLRRAKYQEDELSRARYLLVDLSLQKLNIRDAMFNSMHGKFGVTGSKFKKQNTQLLKSQEFESMTTNFIGTSKFADSRFKILSERIDLILALIEKEVEK